MSSLAGDGRRARQLQIAAIAIERQRTSENHMLQPQYDTNYGIIWTFVLIVLGGTLLTLATIQHSELMYAAGIIVLFGVAAYLCLQSSRLKSPCSEQ